MLTRRVTLFLGHYGSGKTNAALNYAMRLKASGLPVAIADLDIVNPYFRTKDSEDVLRQAGIELVSPEFAGSNVDLPSLPAAAYGLVQRRDRHVVIDVGGDDRGALALGRYVPYLREENDYEALFVVNFYRPLTQTPADALEVLREIEAAARLSVTGIVNNSNLGEATTADDVRRSFPLAAALCGMTGLPLRMTCAEERIASQLDCEDLLALTLQKKPF